MNVDCYLLIQVFNFCKCNATSDPRTVRCAEVVYLHVWRDLVEVDPAVPLHVVLGVDLQVFVRVN